MSGILVQIALIPDQGKRPGDQHTTRLVMTGSKAQMVMNMTPADVKRLIMALELQFEGPRLQERLFDALELHGEERKLCESFDSGRGYTVTMENRDKEGMRFPRVTVEKGYNIPSEFDSKVVFEDGDMC